jgi:hypothetical protein
LNGIFAGMCKAHDIPDAMRPFFRSGQREFFRFVVKPSSTTIDVPAVLARTA